MGYQGILKMLSCTIFSPLLKQYIKDIDIDALDVLCNYLDSIYSLGLISIDTLDIVCMAEAAAWDEFYTTYYREKCGE